MHIINGIIDIALPRRCASCECLLYDTANLCYQCWSGIHFISGVICSLCGYPMEFDLRDHENGKMLCGGCIRDKKHFTYARSVCSYNSIVANIIAKLKYEDSLYVVDCMANFLTELYLNSFRQCQIICPVPIHSTSLRGRMFNQSALLCIAVVKRLKKRNISMVYIPDLIRKHKITPRQNLLTRAQRIENVKGSFCINQNYNLSGQSILILDDVITTGSTINECAKIVKKYHKKSKVYAMSFARTTLIDAS